MRVLSLYDGMACGHIAFTELGIEVESYDAYEIDKYAIQTATHNFPGIVEHGDAFAGDYKAYEGVDFLVGGSPCTYWSIARKEGRETTASGMGWDLFCQYVRALREAKPRWFIYENNAGMSNDIRDAICRAFGFNEVQINSDLVSGQRRDRYYWVGQRNAVGGYDAVIIEKPEDMEVDAKAVLDHGIPVPTTVEGKAYALTASYWKGHPPARSVEKRQRTLVAERATRGTVNRVYEVRGGKMLVDGEWHPMPLPDGDYYFRLFSVREAARLQTIPEWYEFPTSKTRALQCIGNGWTIRVIMHLISACLAGKTATSALQMDLF